MKPSEAPSRQKVIMHWHPEQQDPSPTQAYCPEHAFEDEPMYECWSERCVCIVCEEQEEPE